jgi:hypothetical protein
MATLEETYTHWRATLHEPDDSLFYYHPSMERILLGLAIFVLTPQPALGKLGKAEPLKILHLQVPDLITAWIDEDEKHFETLFKLIMMLSENYLTAAAAYGRKYPSRRKNIEEVMAFFAQAVACGGDMTPALAEELLDDLTTDDHRIYSDKIKAFGSKLWAIAHKYGMDYPPAELTRLNGW